MPKRWLYFCFFSPPKNLDFSDRKAGGFHLDQNLARLAWPISWSIPSPVRWRWGWADTNQLSQENVKKPIPEKTNISSENWWFFSDVFFSFAKPSLFRDMLIFFRWGIPFWGPILLDWLVNRDSHKGRFHHPYKPRAVWPIWHPTTWGVFCCWTWIVLGAVFGTSWYRNQPGSERGVIVKRELSIESEILWDGTVYLRDHRSYIHFCLRGWILNLWQLGGGCETTLPKGA